MWWYPYWYYYYSPPAQQPRPNCTTLSGQCGDWCREYNNWNSYRNFYGQLCSFGHGWACPISNSLGWYVDWLWAQMYGQSGNQGLCYPNTCSCFG